MSAVHGPWAVSAERSAVAGSQAPDQSGPHRGAEADGMGRCRSSRSARSPGGLAAPAAASAGRTGRGRGGLVRSQRAAAPAERRDSRGAGTLVRARRAAWRCSGGSTRSAAPGPPCASGSKSGRRAPSAEELDRLVDEGVATTDSLARIVPLESRRPSRARPLRRAGGDAARVRRIRRGRLRCRRISAGLVWPASRTRPPGGAARRPRLLLRPRSPLQLPLLRPRPRGRTHRDGSVPPHGDSGSTAANGFPSPSASPPEEGITPRFSLPSRAQGAAVWDWVTADGQAPERDLGGAHARGMARAPPRTRQIARGWSRAHPP